MEQCLFDEFVLFVLETISSKQYLDDLKINRPASVNWESFVRKVSKQTVKPGIYPRSFGKAGVHYYAVRQGDVMQVGNGYPSLAGINSDYSIGLDAQKDHSHGLCQTYALMFYNFQEGRLLRGEANYFNNVLIGFNYLLEFINDDYQKRERCWSPASMHQYMTEVCDNHEAERLKNIRAHFKRQVCLTDLIKLILSAKYRNNLKVWFGDDRPLHG